MSEPTPGRTASDADVARIAAEVVAKRPGLMARLERAERRELDPTPTLHCPACRIADELTAHRNLYEADWSTRRAAFNFAIVLARRACPAYQPAREDRV